jgi:hypothetical protein
MGFVVSDPVAYSVRRPSELLTPVPRIVHRVITRSLIKPGPKRCATDTGAVTLIQRFGSAVNLTSICIVWCSMESIGVPRANQISMQRAPQGDRVRPRMSGMEKI